MAQKIIMILGPTACGKTKFGVSLTARLNGEIISADSRQVYRGLDIGTGKDLSEYTLPDGTVLPFHLIDCVDPDREYSLADFLTDASRAIDDISERGKVPVIVGGTALYLHGLLSSYQLRGGAPDSEKRAELRNMNTEQLRNLLIRLNPDSIIPAKEPENRIRLIRAIELAQGGDTLHAKEPVLPTDRKYLIFGVYRTREDVRSRIEMRLRQRIEEENMLDESIRLHNEGMSWERMEFLGLEYRYMALYQQGKISYDEMFQSLLNKIRQFAKRQDSWFRKMENDGFPIYWIPPEETDRAVTMAKQFLAGETLPPPVIRLTGIKYGRSSD